ncbi:hypothetical protein PCC7424_1464 [Gloeothece citriformis PCC 7424]|uniref:Uncharacterized protein n=1 Tax=Gloeothece citriformis (strain PCC 7424) TaxID=65393 RepID=B7K8E6_GLOC7|nr:hypothetical protein [Gloeothece citriformis]ACK69906.1 hypothetical protein PCC7424_1464 [Gloeothece citriformis PCC 7424]
MQAREIRKTSVSCSVAFLTPQPGMWIPLEELPSPFAHDEALLLCQLSKNRWVSWIPDHGEYILEFV